MYTLIGFRKMSVNWCCNFVKSQIQAGKTPDPRSKMWIVGSCYLFVCIIFQGNTTSNNTYNLVSAWNWLIINNIFCYSSAKSLLCYIWFFIQTILLYLDGVSVIIFRIAPQCIHHYLNYRIENVHHHVITLTHLVCTSLNRGLSLHCPVLTVCGMETRYATVQVIVPLYLYVILLHVLTSYVVYCLSYLSLCL